MAILAVTFDLLLLMLLWLLGAGLGRLVLRGLGLLDALTALERLLIGAAVGLGAVSYAVLLVGWVGLLNIPAFSVMLLLLLAVAALAGRGPLADAGAVLRGIPSLFRRPLPALLTALMMVGGLAAMLGALAPPTDWDPMVYHLAFPKLYVEHGRVLDILFDHRALFPENGEMLYTLALLFGRQGLTGLLHWSMAIASAAAIFAFCRNRLHASPTFSLLAAAIFLSTPMVLMQATTQNVDLNVGFYDFIALYAFFVWMQSLREDAAAQQGGINHAPTSSSNLKPQTSNLVLMGLLAGLCYANKESAVINGVAIGLLLVWVMMVVERRGLAATLRAGLIYSGVTLATLFIWPLKAWLASGNPFWPAVYGLFGGKAWSWADNDYQFYGYSVVYGMRYPPGTTFNQFGTSSPQDLVSSYLLWPWNATIRTMTFDMASRYGHSIGPLYLALLPLGTLVRLVRGRIAAGSPLLLLSIYSVVFLLGWMFFLHHMARFFLFNLPVFAILVAAAAYLLMGLPIEGRANAPTTANSRLRPIIAALVGIWLVLGVADHVYYEQRDVGVVLGTESAADFLARDWWPSRTLAWANQTLPPDAKMLMGWGAQAYYLDRDFIYAEHAPEYVGRYSKRSPQEFLARLKELGISDIIVAYPSQFAIREVFPPDFVSDNGPYTCRLGPDFKPSWSVYRVNYSGAACGP